MTSNIAMAIIRIIIQIIIGITGIPIMTIVITHNNNSSNDLIIAIIINTAIIIATLNSVAVPLT